ncbi:Hypothetical protein UVM_LOCUS337 [uncultured virus]|nr:Hypothetical protein UVM_LOCUS337 [uncultured virus]
MYRIGKEEHEKYIARIGKEVHEKYVARFVKADEPCPNPLLYDLWLPWAKKMGYAGGSFFDFANLCENIEWFTTRDLAIRDFSWAIPTAAALRLCMNRAPDGRIVEIGSGLGYWASLLERHGADVVAVDDHSEREARTLHFARTVQQEGVKYLQENDGCADRALLLCWPRSADEFLQKYRGNTLLFVGELDGGCTWSMDGSVHEPEWEECERLAIPTWVGIHDLLVVYARKQSK